jgi:hypothetical protein
MEKEEDHITLLLPENIEKLKKPKLSVSRI